MAFVINMTGQTYMLDQDAVLQRVTGVLPAGASVELNYDRDRIPDAHSPVLLNLISPPTNDVWMAVELGMKFSKGTAFSLIGGNGNLFLIFG